METLIAANDMVNRIVCGVVLRAANRYSVIAGWNHTTI